MWMENITKITLAWELTQEGIKQQRIAVQVGVDRTTVYRWILGIEKAGSLEVFLEQYLRAKKGERKKRKVEDTLKRKVWNLRENYRGCCGQKIAYFLQKDYGIQLGVTRIYEILAEKYQLRSKWKKNQVRGPIPEAHSPREVVQMDSLDFGEVFAFTGIDIYSKEADIRLSGELTAQEGYVFLQRSMARRFNGYVELIQTDGGPEFKEEFAARVLDYSARHRVARPYKKNEQSYIESFNRTVRKECLGWSKYKKSEIPFLQKEVEAYLDYYHYTRPHLSLGMKPPLGDSRRGP
jgi:transposase